MSQSTAPGDRAGRPELRVGYAEVSIVHAIGEVMSYVVDQLAHGRILQHAERAQQTREFVGPANMPQLHERRDWPSPVMTKNVPTDAIALHNSIIVVSSGRSRRAAAFPHAIDRRRPRCRGPSGVRTVTAVPAASRTFAKAPKSGLRRCRESRRPACCCTGSG